MSKRKLALYALICVLALTLAACGNSAPPASDTESGASEPADENGYVEVFADENVTVSLSFNRNAYNFEEIIGLEATITNNCANTIVFPVGSGSNRVPDGLTVTIGSLADMYKPAIMTMDFRIHELASGESITYQLPYAPFVALGDGVIPGAGLDQTIEFFQQSENYIEADRGDTQGTLRFVYDIAEDPEDLSNLLGGEFSNIIEGTFYVQIIE